MSFEKFVNHHKWVHARIFCSLPIVKQKVRRYVQQHSLDIVFPGMPDSKFDGITELWFDSVDDIEAVFDDPEYLQMVRPDENLFLNLTECEFLISTESVIFCE